MEARSGAPGRRSRVPDTHACPTPKRAGAALTRAGATPACAASLSGLRADHGSPAVLRFARLRSWPLPLAFAPVTFTSADETGLETIRAWHP